MLPKIHFIMNWTDPPSTPVISGYTEGSVIPAGSSQKLLCMSSGGNPPATLTWFKNDKKVNKTWREKKSFELIISLLSLLFLQINSQTKTINNSVQSELNIIANITDNQAIYRCEAQNSATDVPLLDSKTLSVHCKYKHWRSHCSYACIAHETPTPLCNSTVYRSTNKTFFPRKKIKKEAEEIFNIWLNFLQLETAPAGGFFVSAWLFVLGSIGNFSPNKRKLFPSFFLLSPLVVVIMMMFFAHFSQLFPKKTFFIHSFAWNFKDSHWT